MQTVANPTGVPSPKWPPLNLLPPPQRLCEVKITMSDGSSGAHVGWYPCAVDAVLRALEIFPNAQRVGVVVTRPERGGSDASR